MIMTNVDGAWRGKKEKKEGRNDGRDPMWRTRSALALPACCTNRSLGWFKGEAASCSPSVVTVCWVAV